MTRHFKDAKVSYCNLPNLDDANGVGVPFFDKDLSNKNPAFLQQHQHHTMIWVANLQAAVFVFCSDAVGSLISMAQGSVRVPQVFCFSSPASTI